jgi:8-oxo-dGTP pyrophosphatase MutT (NUDIX family)
VVPVLDDGRVVMVRQFRYPLGQVLLEFPAGKIDLGEPPSVCARRELREETGYTARQWARACHIHNAAAYSTEGIEIWFATGLEPGPQALDSGEFLEVVAVTEQELDSLAQAGQLTDVKTLIGLQWLRSEQAAAADAPGSAVVNVSGGELRASRLDWSADALVIDGEIRLPAAMFSAVDYAAGRIVPLASLTGADDLKAVEALAGTSGLLAKTAANAWALRAGEKDAVAEAVRVSCAALMRLARRAWARPGRSRARSACRSRGMMRRRLRLLPIWYAISVTSRC